MSENNPQPSVVLPDNLPPSTFRFGHVDPNPERSTVQEQLALPPDLGPLAPFAGSFTGNGFNTIFRPNLGSPTTGLPKPPVGPNDNLLELNLTAERLTFLQQSLLSAVPNRGEVQPDITLSGLTYLQTVEDATQRVVNVPPSPLPSGVGIHLETGLWMHIPATTDPAEGVTVTRMGSIPHGTTICAEGTVLQVDGGPQIHPVDITPLNQQGQPVKFPSQTAAQDDTWRIPQNLAPYIAAGKITQAILDDPNTVLRNAIAGQKITKTTVLSISTNPAAPLFGGGTDNIAFLLGEKDAANPNAQATQMTAVFWIETVEHTLRLPPIPHSPGQESATMPVEVTQADRPVPQLLLNPPSPIPAPGTITFTSTQIQYTQLVLLNFNQLIWPHVSMATLVPSGPLIIPPEGWAAYAESVQREHQGG